MKNLFLFISLVIALTSCNNIKPVIAYKKNKSNLSQKSDILLNEAKKYLGTPYQYGGTSKKGMDCSGLIINSFQSIQREMPRVSKDQAKEGTVIKLKNVQPGDLLFFNTSGSDISHVGIVERVTNNEIFFIHASSSKGVMISSLASTYWNKRFVKATRVL